ncbi:transcriptional regulator with XRE-family HTH domain [Devosia sp. UYZn731]|uniref:helix-turn-helix domain-containing protein n=1 Tax=Devosia sp. UYZn731 TaxID=3156345 RepID=UPI0033914429
MDTRALIGWNLRKLRVGRGLSQERLALEAGIDRAYVGRVERGEENVTTAVLDAFASVLDTHVRDFFAVVPEGEKFPEPLRPGRKASSDR